MRKITNVLHESAVQSGCVSSNVCKPKPYWCPKLSKIRDKKRLWWHIWVDNGKQRQGAVYEAYKDIKAMFRRESRRAMTNMPSGSFNSLNELFYNK